MKGTPWIDLLYRILLLLFLAGASVEMIGMCLLFAPVMELDMDAERMDAFRRQELSAETLEYLEQAEEQLGLSKGELLSVWMPAKRFDLSSPEGLPTEQFSSQTGLFERYRKKEAASLRSLYGAIWDDLVYFPTETGVTYEDSWMFERNYGGRRGHEGCDLMPPENVSGRYPVFSMTDGVVEKIGWLEKGGYRIGIRSPKGGYFYYAHLSDYGGGFSVGQRVRAGEILGFMGDTGYGPEPTRGKFDVHLHLGIYVNSREGEEISVNPYWILKSLERRKLKYRH